MLCNSVNMHGKCVYSTLALEEIVKEETALRKEICCYAVQGCIHSYNYIYRQPRRLRKPHAHMYIQAAAMYVYPNMHTGFVYCSLFIMVRTQPCVILSILPTVFCLFISRVTMLTKVAV